jgi:hypothetical protein
MSRLGLPAESIDLRSFSFSFSSSILLYISDGRMNLGVPIAVADAGDSGLELVRGSRPSAPVSSGLSLLVMLLFRGGNGEEEAAAAAAAPLGPGDPATCGGGVCVVALVGACVWICSAGGPLALLFPAACFSKAMRSLGLRLPGEPTDPEAGVGGPLLLEMARSPAVSLPGLWACAGWLK